MRIETGTDSSSCTRDAFAGRGRRRQNGDVTPLRTADWLPRRDAHVQRVSAELSDVVARRERGEKHPVDDFLWHYYNLRPSKLIAWHPGIGVEVEDGAEHGVATFDAAGFASRREDTIRSAHRLLVSVQAARPRFGCFGMHEWAMVHGQSAGETRHPYLPLRFTPEETARIVEEVGCRCSHFDAFRFFTPTARPLNLLTPTRETQHELDQPGCLHVNMDLYKWAGKLAPATPSELLFDCFRLARDIREVDMRASAYDLTGWGYEPIPVETAEGRGVYAAHQRGFTDRAEPLRTALIDLAEQLLALVEGESVTL